MTRYVHRTVLFVYASKRIPGRASEVGRGRCRHYRWRSAALSVSEGGGEERSVRTARRGESSAYAPL